ncbi:AtpZ/AtpI family protein [Flavihumibacter sp. CACIAM 22H1]|uniref:AtpZ/AtpI family protein n=1 Tax=Flavihumibacter sp. CACIAM 22H1 TaxID=1812911 RepID=UPI0025BD3334|nr:AtpZ/AtpI family protein [Flavihumibacter sp. CACIAM 22H1]
MKNRKTRKLPDKNTSLLRYISLGTQLMVALGAAVWAGIQIDKRLSNPMPLLVWILPLLVIAVTIYKLVKETAGKSNGKKTP